MSLPKINPTTTKAWKLLQQHCQEIRNQRIIEWFKADKNRIQDFSLVWQDFYVDYSKQHIGPKTMQYLLDFAHEMKLGQAIAAYYDGATINETEGRAVLHTALRTTDKEVVVAGENLAQEVQQVQEKMQQLCEAVVSGTYKGYTGKSIQTIVNIGIGGSDLGPQMVVDALAYYRNRLDIAFISNVEGDHVMEVLQSLDPETTLFVVVSKSFTTQETLANAQTVRSWFLERATEADIAKHFVAVSTNLEAVAAFGIAPDLVFPMWNWVGGRFSLWSAVGLSIALAVGYENFSHLLAGASEMDNHFKETEFSENIPVILALLSVWNNNFMGAETQAIIPYTQYLGKLPAYLQQAIMESNGKSVDRNGEKVNYETGTVIWGATGTNAQHAFFQLMHQGTKYIPSDFIAFAKSLHGADTHQDKLMANFIAQTEALMVGKCSAEVEKELQASGMSKEAVAFLKPYKVFDGNRASTSILIEKLTPASIGKLIAMYEHKIFVEGILWNIYSYDQWGVELGKQLADKILSFLNKNSEQEFDASTSKMLRTYQEKR